MIKIGNFNTLTVKDAVPFGFVLQHIGNDETVVLPTDNAPEDIDIGDILDVFVYPGEHGALTASLKKPLAYLGETKVLKAVGVTEFGAFFDWGIERDLLVPSAYQDAPINEGMQYVVHVFYDDATQRLLGATRLHYFLREKQVSVKADDDVELLVYAKTDLGYKVVIDDTYLGLVFHSEAFKPLRIGQRTSGVIKQIRTDGKIDVILQRQNQEGRDALQQAILDDLEAHGGISSLTDKSPAEEIYARFNVSKGAYKKAIGALYKQKKILLNKQSVKLLP